MLRNQHRTLFASLSLLSLIGRSFAFTPTKLKFGLRTAHSETKMNSETHYDYLVIGGGSGGVASARRAASYGAKVCLVEKAALGGTCVNVGCVPKKIMFNAATVSEIIHDAKQFGFHVDGFRFEWNELKVARDAYIARLNGIYGRLLTGSKVDYVVGAASFNGPKSVVVEGKTYTAENILIAVGGKPAMPNIPGVEHCISSDGFFALDTQPKRVAVVGGGYIGVELAGVFHGLGTETHLFTRAARPLKGFDTMIVDTLLSEMKKQKLTYHPNCSPESVKKGSDGTLSFIDNNGLQHGPFDQVCALLRFTLCFIILPHCSTVLIE